MLANACYLKQFRGESAITIDTMWSGWLIIIERYVIPYWQCLEKLRDLPSKFYDLPKTSFARNFVVLGVI